MVKRLKLGQEVYVVNKRSLCIIKETVLAIGEDIFIPEGFQAYTEEWQLISFDDTFLSFEKARLELAREYRRQRKEYDIPKSELKEVYKGIEWSYCIED